MDTPDLQSSTPDAAATRSARLLIVVGLVLTTVIGLLLVARMLPTGVPGQWEWPWRDLDYECPAFVWSVPMVGAAMLALLLALLRRARITRAAVAGFVLPCCLAAATMTLVLENAEPPSPPVHAVSCTLSAMTTAYLSYATSLSSAGAFLRHVSGDDQGLAAMPARVTTHPPGPVLLYYAGLHVLRSWPALTVAVEEWLYRHYSLTPERLWAVSRWYMMPSVQVRDMVPALILGLCVTLLGAGLPLPLYFIGRALHSREAGLACAFAVLLIPSFVVFFPSIDTLGALLALTPVALWMTLLRRQLPWLAPLAGLALAAAAFWSVGLIAVVVAMAAVTVPALRDPQERLRAAKWIGFAAAAFAGVYLLLYLTTGYNWIVNVGIMMRGQAQEMVTVRRTYLPWLTGNLWEVMLFMGPGLLAAACASLALGRRLSTTARWYLVGSFTALGLVWLSGSTLGEVGRIWLFLMSLLVPGAVLALLELRREHAAVLAVALALLQSACVVVLHCRLALVHP